MPKDRHRARIESFRDLVAWQKAIDMVDMVYDLTAKFPRDEMFGLVSQMRRAAVSVPSDVAEGYARRHLKEYLRFVDMARGSLCELQTQAIISRRRGFLSDGDAASLQDATDEVGKLLYGLAESLRRAMPKSK